MSGEEIVVIGAGMAGLTCARMLADAGHATRVLDKGRGIGGRLATRRTPDGSQFDHGAQYVTARTNGFGALLDEMRTAGAAAMWDDRSDRDHAVGTPGMSALAKHLGAGLAVDLATEVTGLNQTGETWEVEAGTARHRAQIVVVTTPAPQAAALIGADHALAARLAAVEIAPCLTLMATFRPGQPVPFISRRAPEDDLAWIAYNSSKPDRPGPGCWVAQASPDWSAAHLEQDRDAIAAEMLPMLCGLLGADPAAVIHAAAHRWRYARVTAPLGAPYLSDAGGTLYLGGDWCLGPRVECAWSSGAAIARAILGRA